MSHAYDEEFFWLNQGIAYMHAVVYAFPFLVCESVPLKPEEPSHPRSTAAHLVFQTHSHLVIDRSLATKTPAGFKAGVRKATLLLVD